MTTDIAALAEVLTDLPEAPSEVQQAVGAQLLYALGLRRRPELNTEQDDLGRAA